jgi:hypothetical protein
MPLHHLAVAAALAACAPAGKAIVAEVYYDAPGDDTGHEFVEFFNPLDRALSLAGARLEAGDGSGPARWTLRWTGGPLDSVPARGRFVLGGALVTPAPQAVVSLDLQNGPDALRVTWPDGAREVVGWGTHDYAEYACGAAAADVPSGQSLARVPDDADLGDNALDFRAAEPSPGRANQRQRDAATVRGTLVVSPEQPGPAETVALSVMVANSGNEALAAGEATLTFSGDALAETLAIALPALEAGESLLVARGFTTGEPGIRRVIARIALAGDEAPANDADTLALRVGLGPLEVTEVQFHPGAGEGEWVEVRNRTDAPLALAEFTIADHASAGATVASALLLAPDSLAVLAQDRPAFLLAFPEADTARVAAAAPWASLNNSDGPDGTADAVVVRGRDGLLDDRVEYSAAGIPAGTPLEKRGGAWAPCTSSRGTPLASPRTRAADGTAFALSPRRLRPGERELLLAWTLPWARGRVTVELYDLAGRRASRLLDEVASGTSDERRAPTGELPPGLYVAVLRAHDGARTLTRQALLRVAGERP